MWRLLTVVVAILALTACGGGSDSTVDTESYESTAALGRALGCESYQDVPKMDRVVLVTDQGSCQVEGEKIYLFVFANNADRDRYVGLADTFGYVRLLGDRWVVQASRATLNELQGDVGGRILPRLDG